MVVTTTVDDETPTVQTLDFGYDASGMPVTVTTGGATYYYITNLQGDVMALVDSTGTTVAQYSYDPYGNVLTATGDLAEINPLTYRGYVYDTESTLYYLQSRYYDPELGRFINADSYASTGQGIIGNNMFAYCGNNPVIHTDPSGTLILIDDVTALLMAYWGLMVVAIIWSPPVQQLIRDFVNGIVTSIEILINEVGNILYAKQKGKQNIRHSEYADLTNEQVSQKAHDPKTPPDERKKLLAEEKGRGLRNKQKRKDLYLVCLEDVYEVFEDNQIRIPVTYSSFCGTFCRRTSHDEPLG